MSRESCSFYLLNAESLLRNNLWWHDFISFQLNSFCIAFVFFLWFFFSLSLFIWSYENEIISNKDDRVPFNANWLFAALCRKNKRHLYGSWAEVDDLLFIEMKIKVFIEFVDIDEAHVVIGMNVSMMISHTSCESAMWKAFVKQISFDFSQMESLNQISGIPTSPLSHPT